ncbi:sugar-phosphatase [Clostridium folliculivorans]|uniref:Hydrolase n=1 Tax=Clostridium folliculivorans TaxID=2886038 RepID=A0A9W6DCD8_9CLOT|nr:sugar-phosphatase [Clostridium folliculivorans]GKU27209.1 hydrolase [Clostridium folliculivorans]GKU31622.1 hydrolase [Clostridium folliculivorans]
MYKLIAIDMDGTLLKEDKTVSDITKKAIARAKKRGVKVVLASGRPIEGITRYLEALNLIDEDDYVLSFNGALIQNTKTKEVISKNILKGTDIAYLYGLSKELGVNIHAFDKTGCITPKMSKYTEVEGTINGIDVSEVDFDKVDSDADISKIMMIDEPEILQAAIEKLPKEVYDKYTVVRSAPYFLEFLNKKSNKGEGVKALADYLGIKQEEVICVGDAGNDLHMIEFAGLGVAMGNAFDEVKQVANYVTSTNEDDGVAEVIEKFILAC